MWNRVHWEEVYLYRSRGVWSLLNECRPSGHCWSWGVNYVCSDTPPTQPLSSSHTVVETGARYDTESGPHTLSVSSHSPVPVNGMCASGLQ